MEKTLQSGWLFAFIATLILIGINVFLNKNLIKFCFNKFDFLTSSGIGVLFCAGLYALNFGTDLIKSLLALVLGLILSLFIQGLETKKEVLAGLGTFALFLIVYKFIGQANLILIGLFIVPVLVSSTLSIIKSNELLNNKLTPIAVLLPLYASLAWFKALGLGIDEIFTRTLLIFTVGVLALITTFTLDFDIKVNPMIKRAGIFIIVALLTYLIVHNFLTLPLNYVYLIIGGFLFANTLNLLNVNSDQNVKDVFFNSIAGFVLTLLVGFIATRLFGTWGLLLVSLCCIGTLSAESKNIVNFPTIAAMFFSIKAIVQVFIQSNTLNVTGLNLNHPYVYAGLLIGFALPILILYSVVIYNKELKSFNPLVLVISALIVPLISAYLIHTEATGALIIALSVSAMILVIAGPIFADKFNFDTAKNYSNAMLPLTGLVGIMLINFQRLIDIGNLASRLQRVEVIVSIVIILTIVFIALFKTSKQQS